MTVRPKGMKSRKVVVTYATDGQRERVELECGHELLLAPRTPARKRMYCPECNYPDAE